jgi:glycosidase
VYEYDELEFEPERFSPDLDWMPRLMLIAKNTYVWLDQLSQKYGRHISRLDQIPDEELDLLAHWGFTGLWFIGIWERSSASRRVKQLCGNPEAVASAYSVYDYQIAAELGGQAAYESLRDRAWQRGIRLVSDMVPNHVGIYSRWMLEHPEWFISLDHCPFPAYSFDGPDLSEDERVGIYLEDHYYDRSDAAVVFQRVDRWTGDVKYIYHGNDGTSMPWNDTAQLNYLDPEVREAVIQTILHVARLFPVIRFDAAMTLTKRHFRRLWFPEPGTGGAIPTRAEHGLTKADFDAAMPIEFWREVVDRVAAEAPDTLLLAEAFWLLEGFFVRTLGMHRVYNSAFMNMLRDEENANYRSVMKNTLEFDPEILRRFVNFMNNPDEESSVAQFGKGDKYFGVCTMLSTLPGLPMFGHGQIEGFAEKYGMEYRRAYWDEQPDGHLIERHEREIFPLLHRRHLFAGVEQFLLYDFFTREGSVNEDVFAYSNRHWDERALVVYHNRFATARGWIRSSVAYSVKVDDDGDRALVQRTLGDGLGLVPDEGTYYVFRDSVTGLEYIREGKELCEQGLYVELEAYRCHVFLDWRKAQDNEWKQYAHLAAYLNGRGVPNIEEALQEIFLQPVHDPFRDLVNGATLRQLMAARVTEPDGQVDPELAAEVEGRVMRLLREVTAFAAEDKAAAPIAPDQVEIAPSEEAAAQEIRHKLEAALELPVLAERYPLPRSRKYQDAVAMVHARLAEDPASWATLFSWLFTHSLGSLIEGPASEARSRSLMDEWLLGKLVATSLQDVSGLSPTEPGPGLDEAAALRAVGLVKILITHQRWFEIDASQKQRAYRVLVSWLKDKEVQEFIRVNRYAGILWFNEESFEELLGWMLIVAALEASANPALSKDAVVQEIVANYDLLRRLQRAADESEYQIAGLLEAAQG